MHPWQDAVYSVASAACAEYTERIKHVFNVLHAKGINKAIQMNVPEDMFEFLTNFPTLKHMTITPNDNFPCHDFIAYIDIRKPDDAQKRFVYIYHGTLIFGFFKHDLDKMTFEVVHNKCVLEQMPQELSIIDVYMALLRKDRLKLD